MLNGMTKKMDKTIKKIQNEKTISSHNLDEILSELKINLLDADVNLAVVKKFLFHVSQKSKGKFITSNKTTSQEIMKIVTEELTNMLGKVKKEIDLSTSPGTLMMVGLQGSGKTTSVSKIANYLSKKKKSHKKPLLVACDIYRPAAIDQLETLAKQIEVDIYFDKKEKNVNKIAQEALKVAKREHNDLIIFDTAGRLHIDEKLMLELKDLKKLIKPEEIIMTVDAMSGQDIIQVVQEFDKALNLTGTMITKFDSDARVGSALSISDLTGIPIKLIGVGEKVKDVELFHPDRIASRILGLGDMDTLIEKAQEVGDESKNEKMYRRLMSGKFDLVDLMVSMEEMAKIGSMGAIAKMIPGAGKMLEDNQGMDEKLKSFQVLINSMTLKEKRNPKLLNHPKRKERIMKGSGKTVEEYNLLIRQFQKSKKQMDQLSKMMKSGKMPNLNNMNNGGGGNPFSGF